MNIYESIAAVMADCKAVGKNEKNPQQNYKYRGIDAVMNALNPALTKNKVFVSPEVMDVTREERTTSKGGLLIYSVAKVKYTFYAEDGSNISAVVIGEAMDSGDKSMNKAMSAAFKYALFQVFCIPTEEMIDSEVDSPEPRPRLITTEQRIKIYQEINRTHINKQAILDSYKVTQLEDLNIEQGDDLINKLSAKPTYEEVKE